MKDLEKHHYLLLLFELGMKVGAVILFALISWSM